jgi:hypothetical protein
LQWDINDSKQSFVNECAFVYQEIVENNQIIATEYVKENVASWEIDAFIQTYMCRHGIDNVRGGRYNKKTLSDAAKDEISNAIKYFTFGLDNQNKRGKIYHEYEKNIDSEEIYRENIQKYEKLNSERMRYEINRNVVYDINWLSRIIENEVSDFFEINDKYDNIMNQLSTIYKQYLNVIEDAREQIDMIHLQYNNCVKCENLFTVPNLFFDSRVIKRERTLNKYNCKTDKSLICVIKIFELVIYSLINREDEEIFELNQINLQENKDKLFIIMHKKKIDYRMGCPF